MTKQFRDFLAKLQVKVTNTHLLKRKEESFTIYMTLLMMPAINLMS